MNKILVLLALSLLTKVSFGGGFMFPNFEYEYSKIYLFNIDFKETKRPDQKIYANDLFAFSKIGDGIQLTEDQNKELSKIFARGADELRSGMSKCYLPRHGIIYFDKMGNPLGSLSICFECQKIVFWSTRELPDFNDDYSKYDYEKADDQLAKLQNLVEEIGLPVYDDEDLYNVYRDTSANYAQSTWIKLEDPMLDSLYFKAYTVDSVKSWITNPKKYSLREDVNIEISAGGEEYRFNELYGKDGSQYQFDGDDAEAHLVYASIKSPFVKLPNGVMLGMSLDDVMGKIITVYDGPSNPKEIIHHGQFLKITYRFEFRTLKQVVLEFNS